MKSRNQSGSAHVVIIIVLVVVLIGALGFIFWQNFIKTDQPTANTSQTVKQDTTEEAKDGTIVGSLTYPSEGIPEDLVVYAQNIDTNKEYSTTKHLEAEQYKYSKGYALDVPAGRYYVYGVLASDPEHKAYYNQYITCGMSVNCKDTTKIEVTVKPGEKTADITVGDWWNV